MTGITDQSQRAIWGLVCAAAVAGVAAITWGPVGFRAAAIMGAVAAGVQLLAARAMAKTGESPTPEHLKVYGIGVILRLSGVVVLGVAVHFDREFFPPLASATGYLGTVLPLLYLETRLAR
jgi:hypothetical protein